MKILDFLKQNKIDFKQDVMLKDLTNFKIGGKCKVVVFPNTKSKLIKLLTFLKNNKLLFYVLGAGTNVLASDRGYKGILIKLSELKEVKVKNNIIIAQAGVNLFDLNKVALRNGLTGLEFSFGIPGSVGGACYMNAGAFNHNISEKLECVEVFDGEKVFVLNHKDLCFGYRDSVFSKKKLVIISAKFVLENGDKERIKQEQKRILNRRLFYQPYDLPSAGSVFKRLDGGEKPVSALIDQVGLKGKTIGGAQVSKKHAGFIVNIDNASCKDVKHLIKYIRKVIKKAYNLKIEQEIVEIGVKNGIIW